MLDMKERPKYFPAAVVSAAKTAQTVTGCLASVTLAQFALESAYGKAMPALSNNPFGIKAVKGQAFVSAPTKESVDGKMVQTTAKFAVYPTLAEAFIQHGKLLMDPKGPYRAALPFAKNWRTFVQHIAVVYATDPKYASKLMDIITEWNLTDFDTL